MLPRLKQWLELTLRDFDPSTHTLVGADDHPTTLDDGKLSVSESTITEFSRTIAVYEPKPGQRPRP